MVTFALFQSRYWPLLLLPLLLAPAAVPERTLTQAQGAATARLTGDRLTQDALELRLSNEAHLVLQVEGRAPLEVEVPDPLVHSDAWRVHPQGPAVTSPLADGRARWRQEFDLEPLQTGKHEIQLGPLQVREAGGLRQREVAWQPLPVVVTTQVARPDLTDARDITPIEDVPPRPTWPAWLLAGPSALGGVVLLVALWLLSRRRLPRALPLSPDRAALLELERAGALPLASARDVERYHTQLADVVRRYFERRFHLPASQQTTAEFLESMRRSPHLPAGPQEVLRDFLARCDRGKFAPVTPGPEECRAAAALARHLIEQTAESQRNVGLVAKLP